MTTSPSSHYLQSVPVGHHGGDRRDRGHDGDQRMALSPSRRAVPADHAIDDLEQPTAVVLHVAEVVGHLTMRPASAVRDLFERLSRPLDAPRIELTELDHLLRPPLRFVSPTVRTRPNFGLSVGCVRGPDVQE